MSTLNKKFQEFASATKKSVLLKQELVDELHHYSEIYPNDENFEEIKINLEILSDECALVHSV